MQNNVGYNTVEDNMSGMGKEAFVPEEIAAKFNWGAFLWTFIWGLAHKQPITLLCIVVCFVPVIGPLASLALAIWIGTKGNAWAWQAKRYASIEDFEKRQKKWVFAYFAIIALYVILGITFAAKMFLPMLKTSSESKCFINMEKVYNTLKYEYNAKTARGRELPSYNSQELANFFVDGSKEFKTIKGRTALMSGYDSDDIILTFNAGDCKKNKCAVYVDINGVKGPNKYWKAGDKELSDRYVYRIKYLGDNSYEITPPEAFELQGELGGFSKF